MPTISKILYATGEFGKHTAKRTEDTGLILVFTRISFAKGEPSSKISLKGEALDAYAHLERMPVDSTQEEINHQRQRPIDAIMRLNEIHGKYPILNGDYLYTLSLFIIQPIKWINSYGYRELEQIEKNVRLSRL